jgi:chromosome partitioning protein
MLSKHINAYQIVSEHMEEIRMILLLGGEKGGTGKSTIATNLAVHLALEGHDVMLLDADPQATAAKWIERRNEQSLRTVHCTQKTGDIYKTAIDLGNRYQFVIIDAGGRDSRELRTAMVAADKMYVPLRASQADLETLPHVEELVSLARGMNNELQVYGLLSMAPNNPLIHEVSEAQDLLIQFVELSLSNSIIRDRKAYRDAMLAGKGVVELNNGQAKAEVQLLAQEIFG